MATQKYNRCNLYLSDYRYNSNQLYNLQEPSSSQRPRFVRLYFYDPFYAAQACSTANPNIKETLLRSIMEELKEINGQGGVSQPYIDHHELSQSSPFSGYEPGSLKEDKTRQTHYFFFLYTYIFLLLSHSGSTCHSFPISSCSCPCPCPCSPPPAAMAAMGPFQSLFESMHGQLTSANCKVTKLNGKNYPKWKRDMTLYCTSMGQTSGPMFHHQWTSKSTPHCIFVGYSETENLF